MKSPLPFDDFRSLLDYKYGNTDSPARISFHQQAGKTILDWRSRFSSTFLRRLSAWCQCYLLQSWKRPAYLDRQLARFGYRGQDPRWLIGQTGVAITPLRLQGKVEIMGRTYEATSHSGYIYPDQPIRVVDLFVHQLIVEKTT